MGIYWYVVNLDKKEYIALGKKFGEWLLSDDPKAIFWLLAEDAHSMIMTKEEYDRFIGGNIEESERVINKLKEEFKYLGRWAGDRITAIPDYDEYVEMLMKYKDISLEVVSEIVKALERWREGINSESQECDDMKRIIENFNIWLKILKQ